MKNMLFDPGNTIVQICAQGMQFEGEGNPEAASACFQQAWLQAANDLEKFTAAHYIARHQPTPAEKLQWDQAALAFALQVTDDEIRTVFPSLYLNIAKGYEDLGDFLQAKTNYETARSFTGFLSNDGYGNMIRAGIERGLQRVGQNS